MSLDAVVRSDRLALPLWTREDVEAMRSGERRPGWHPHFPRAEELDAATLWVEGDPWGPRSIVRGVTTLGSVGFFGPPTPAEDGVPETEIGYGLVREAYGWGFATEAVTALLAAADAATQRGVRVRATVEPTNKASLRVLAKTGFTQLRGGDEDGNLVMARPVPVADADAVN